MTQLLASFGKPFKFQVAAFRLRLAELKATTGWDKEVWQAEHDRAFMVAGAIRADILADLAAAVDKAISQGTTLETFRKDFRKIVAEKGWKISPAGQGTKGGEAWRTKVIYKTNLSTSYAAGRFAQLMQAGYPFLVYRHGASVEPRIQHLAWDGLVLPADHAFWKSHCPPNGWGCTCYITGARSKESARRVGGKPEKTLPEGWQSPDPKTGAPVGIDRGWAYAPGATVARSLPVLADKLVAMPAPTSADLISAWPDQFFDVWSEAFAEFIDTIKADVPRGRQMIVGALLPKWVAAAEAQGVLPATAEIVVPEAALRHTFRASKTAQLDQDWYRALPRHLRKPDAVLLDTARADAPAMLLIFGRGAGVPKLVVQVNYFVKKMGRMNVVETGKIIDTTGIALGPHMRLIDGQM